MERVNVRPAARAEKQKDGGGLQLEPTQKRKTTMPKIELSERFVLAILAAILYPRTGDAKQAVQQASELLAAAHAHGQPAVTSQKAHGK